MDTDYTAPAHLPPLLRALLTTTHERHIDMANLVSGLSVEALNWHPFPESASLAGLALHILDVEDYLATLAAGAAKEWSGENGSRMDETAGEVAILAELTRVDAALKSALAGLTPGAEQAIGEAFVEDLDHSAMHYGQMQLTRHAWEAAHPHETSDYTHWR